MKKQLKKILQDLGLKKKGTTIDEWETMVLAYIKEPFDMIAPYIQDDAVFIDVGANIGAFTQQVLKSRKNITAHLFEPIPQYFERVEKKFGNYPNVTCNNLALSDQEGTFSIWIDPFNLGWNTMVNEKTTNTMKELKIKAITFDDYAKQHNITKIDIIKIDVEGAEFKVLSGMKNTLKSLSKKPAIICEIGWGKNAHPNWKEEVEIFEWLFSNGYTRFDYDKITETVDMVFIPN